MIVTWKFPHHSQYRSILQNSREKELLNGYFHSRTFFHFRTVPNALFTLLERFFPLQNVGSVPNGKNDSGVLFSTLTPQNRSFLSLELNIPVLRSSRYMYTGVCVANYICHVCGVSRLVSGILLEDIPLTLLQ